MQATSRTERGKAKAVTPIDAQVSLRRRKVSTPASLKVHEHFWKTQFPAYHTLRLQMCPQRVGQSTLLPLVRFPRDVNTALDG